MILLLLFLSFMQIGILGFGGGYAMLPLISDITVSQQGWLTMTEFTDLVTLSQISPGPILINSATFVGVKTAGITGAVVATAGAVLPSCAIVTVLSVIYSKYRKLEFMTKLLAFLRPAVVGLIAASAVSILAGVVFGGENASLAGIDWIAVGLTAAAFAALQTAKKISPMLIIGLCGALGCVLYSI